MEGASNATGKNISVDLDDGSKAPAQFVIQNEPLEKAPFDRSREEGLEIVKEMKREEEGRKKKEREQPVRRKPMEYEEEERREERLIKEIMEQEKQEEARAEKEIEVIEMS